MERSKVDVMVGLFVLLGGAAIVFLALKSANLLTLNFNPSYAVTAQFDNIGGLKRQAAVKSAGVVVGRVEAISFDGENEVANVKLAIDQQYQFKNDSSLQILTSGLLGEQYIGIEGGGASETKWKAGDVINNSQTQSAVVLEKLISQFMFNKASESGAPAAAPIAPAAQSK